MKARVGAVPQFLLLALLLFGFSSQARPETTGGYKPVPSLVGLTERQAVLELEEKDLESVVLRSYSHQPVGTVLNQFPVAQVYREPGARIQLIVSKGPEPSSSNSVASPELEDTVEAGSRSGATWWLLFQIPLALTAWWGWQRVRSLK